MTIMVGQSALALTEADNPSTTTDAAVEAVAVAAQPAIFTPAQQQEAKEAIQVLGNAFGITQEAAAPQGTAATVAGVADKALDMMAGAVGAIAGKIEQVAPQVWGMMIRQQYAKAVGGLIVPTCLFIAFLIIMIVAKNALKKAMSDDEDDGELTVFIICALVISAIVAVISGIIMVVNAKEGVMILINPEYYAIKDLLQMLLAPGSFVQ